MMKEDHRPHAVDLAAGYQRSVERRGWSIPALHNAAAVLLARHM